MKLEVNQVVVNKRGDMGCVVGFNNIASLVVFPAYCKHPSEYNEELKHKNDNYSIAKVYTVAETVTLKEVMRKSFAKSLDESKLVFETK